VPQPRNGLADAVRDFASSAMDVSDGLAGDLAKLCKASGVSARVNAADIPLSAAAAELLARDVAGLEAVISGGDDYEILCTIPEDRFGAFARAAEAAGIPVTSIGAVVTGLAAPRFVDREGRELALQRLSYSHF
jgi:thiamine-monophosphate kinase